MSALAHVRWIAGPVLRALVNTAAEVPSLHGGTMHADTSSTAAVDAFMLREAVAVGPLALLGEVVGIDANEILVQVYEDTSGLRPGVEVVGSGRPLAVELGPALLGHMFDGLLRPLGAADAAFVQPGMHRRGAATMFDFRPRVTVGAHISPGQWIAEVSRDQGLPQRINAPPDLGGEVIEIAAAGDCMDTAIVCRVRQADGSERGFAMRQTWPVRTPRPVRRRLPTYAPLVTGQRILDALFPVAMGGKAAIPGGFGTGKTVLMEALARGCNADVIVYLGCGERGNEIAGVLEEFPTLIDPRSGRALMQRTVIIANTSNMPVAAREASIYSAVTVAEYFRDQGLHVALMADSTSRWAEALREVSGRFGELPGEGGYPAYLGSRLADFYERAALVETLAGDTGSVTLIGAVSPPSGDLSEPVTSHTKRFVKAFWTLDVNRAHARFYPAVHPLQSYAEDAQTFGAWWSAQGLDTWWTLRRRFLSLLEEQSRLQRMARIIGKDALPPRQQLTLMNAELFNEAFLRQSAFSAVDRIAAPAKQAAMMRLLARWMDLSEQVLAAGADLDQITALPGLRSLTRMGEEIANEQPLRFDALQAQLEAEFGSLLAAVASPRGSDIYGAHGARPQADLDALGAPTVAVAGATDAPAAAG